MSHYYLTLVFIQVLFGANFVISKIVVGTMDPVYFAAIRFVVSGLVLVAFQFFRGQALKVSKDSVGLLIALAIFGIGLGQALFMLGLEKTTAVNTSLISSMIPIFVFIINKIRGIAEWDFLKVMGLLLSFFGVLILRNVEEFNLAQDGLQGDLLVLGACFCLGMMLSFSGDLFKRESAVTGSAHMFWLGGLALFPWMFFREIGDVSHMGSADFLGPFLFAIFGATCLTYLLNNWVLAKVDSTIVGLFIFLQPVIAAFLAYLFLSEPITLRMTISFLMILGGVFMVIAPERFFKRTT